MFSRLRQWGASTARVLAVLLSISAAGVAGILGYEGFRSVPYQDVGGVWTDGYGNTHNVDPNVAVTEPQARETANRHITVFEGGVQNCVHVPLHQHEYDAYVSLTYNIGVNAFCGSTLVRKLNTFDYAGACAEISRWDRVGGRVVRGLTIRREKERALCEGRTARLASTTSTIGIRGLDR